VMNNLPVLDWLRGNMSTASWNTVGSQGSHISALGVDLPAPNALNYGKLLQLKNNDPYSYEVMKSYWAAANRNLDTEMELARARAPLGSARQTTLIET